MEFYFSWNLLCLFLLAQFDSTLCQTDVQATFSMNGVDGAIVFTPAGTDTKLGLSIDVGSEAWTWGIYEFPVDVVQANPCSDDNIGELLIDLTTLKATLTGNYDNEELTLSSSSLTEGDKAFLGRSVVLKSGATRACATIQGLEAVYGSILNGYAAGTIYMRQVGTQLAVFTDLSDTRNSNSESQLSLRLATGTLTPDQPGFNLVQPNLAERCSKIEGDEVIDTIEGVNVAADGQVKKSYHLVSTTTPVTVVSMIVGEYTFCSVVYKYETREVMAKFSQKGVKGYIKFTQMNPFHPTILSLNLTGLDNQATGYHVHKFPVPYKYDTNTQLCSRTGSHFFPLGNEGGSGPSQNDFEIGDLSGKHGSLANKQNIDTTFTDMYLPLFGKYSIMGRSIVIHTASTRWVCTNIGYPSDVIVAEARFEGHAVGSIVLTQEKDKPWSETTIFVSMSTAEIGGSATEKHNYHIHKTSVSGDDLMLDTGRCASTGGHWNPFVVSVDPAGDYKQSCQKNMLRCEVGDISNKFEQMDIGTNDSPTTYMFTDVNVPLSSAYTVIGRSITIHDVNSGGGRYSCANIVERLRSRVKTDDKWVGNGPKKLTGDINFSETKIQAVTKISESLSGLASVAGGYHVHDFPLYTADPGSNVCGTTGAHFNPFNIMYPPQPPAKAVGTHDEYEVGDISRKFGDLADLNTRNEEFMDTNMPLTGNNSINGRSIVVHAVNGSRWRCTNLDFDAEAMGGMKISGVASFEGDIQGSISLSQVINQHGISDVTIQGNLRYKDSNTDPTEQHNYHIHTSPVESDCGSTGGHYNPFNRDVGNDEYKTLCSSDSGESASKYCELGDLSGKFGQISISAGSQFVANDPYISLIGPYSVMGRSIVVHAKNSGAPRIACADIKPLYPEAASTPLYLNADSSQTKEQIASTIATLLEAERGSVYVDRATDSDSDCRNYMVFFSGLNPDVLKSDFNAKKNADDLSDLKTCSGATTLTTTTVLVSLVVYFFIL